MTCDIMAIDDGVVRVRVSDYMRLADQRALQDLAWELIRKGNQVRLPAIVGDECWKQGNRAM